eukprot:4433232-Pleurochrysis_carterae.AAC.2
MALFIVQASAAAALAWSNAAIGHGVGAGAALAISRTPQFAPRPVQSPARIPRAACLRMQASRTLPLIFLQECDDRYLPYSMLGRAPYIGCEANYLTPFLDLLVAHVFEKEASFFALVRLSFHAELYKLGWSRDLSLKITVWTEAIRMHAFPMLTC